MKKLNQQCTQLHTRNIDKLLVDFLKGYHSYTNMAFLFFFNENR